PIKLLKNNIKLFRSQVPWEMMSKTFQEAILAARKLGIRYLWIDIIQDSKEDWLREASLMGRVCTNSSINLSATASEHTF
ncbi:hypothetical protein V2W45_1247712, partial [Cenococcum geophilum]